MRSIILLIISVFSYFASYAYNERDTTYIEEDFISGNLNRWLRPHEIAFIQHKPEDYYSKIAQPILAIYGMMDQNIDWEANSEELQKIFMLNNKTNYEIVTLEETDHNFRPSSQRVPINNLFRVKKEAPFKKEVWTKIAEWINTL
jgi:dipeptidyl aminopeptidase/acylaminoacyl peptidase